ncbi:MAG TPA: excinuclease ABC subunit UvrC, partial [Vicinamibacterales bacterium]|nr:excinuclease ABC subunit UvrC [Vicinamibacterales bacterium]
MPIRNLKTQIGRLPEQPGVYLYFNAGGDTIYVGKARALRDRVRSYLGAYGLNPKTNALLEEADRLEVIVTDSVVEALALENNLIKQRAPKYNILLRDDKSYPYLQLTTGEPFPRVLVARRVERDGHTYAGPFLPARFARKTMALTHRLFGIRSCNEVITGKRARPCLEYDINRCLAPCVDTICSETEYQHAVQDTRLFLEGRSDELTEQLRGRMVEAAEAEQYERAGQLRDAMRTVQTLHEQQQKMARAELGDRDVFGLKVGPAGAVLLVFLVRRGRVIERIELVTESEGGAATSEAEVLQAAIPQFYEMRPVPPDVHLPVDIDDADTVAEWLSARAGRRVQVLSPKRGEKRGLVDLAIRNATLAYQTRFGGGTTANYEALETLRSVLHLQALPRRIECFDISTIQGAETVASMVVCEDGRMRRSEYRKFRVRPDVTGGGRRPPGGGGGVGEDGSGPAKVMGAGSPEPVLFLDDFAAMRQVVTRRYRKLLEAGGPFPDLIVIDGGKGQLAAAYEGLEFLGLANLVAVGLAKKEELIFTRDHPHPIGLLGNDPALLLLQQIRDEAHRF